MLQNFRLLPLDQQRTYTIYALCVHCACVGTKRRFYYGRARYTAHHWQTTASGILTAHRPLFANGRDFHYAPIRLSAAHDRGTYILPSRDHGSSFSAGGIAIDSGSCSPPTHPTATGIPTAYTPQMTFVVFFAHAYVKGCRKFNRSVRPSTNTYYYSNNDIICRKPEATLSQNDVERHFAVWGFSTVVIRAITQSITYMHDRDDSLSQVMAYRRSWTKVRSTSFSVLFDRDAHAWRYYRLLFTGSPRLPELDSLPETEGKYVGDTVEGSAGYVSQIRGTQQRPGGL